MNASLEKAVEFDVERGRVQLRNAERILVPADALATVLKNADVNDNPVLTTLSRSLGAAIGAAMGERLGTAGDFGKVRQTSAQEVLDALSAEWALSGLGSLSLERWGSALVLVVDHCPLGGGAAGFIERVAAAALAAASGRNTSVVCLDREGERSRYAVCGKAGAERLRALLDDGASWGEALVRLHGAPSGGGQ